MIVVKTIYYADDPDCVGDFHSIEIGLEASDEPYKVLKTYGDYNTGGQHKVRGFIDGMKSVFPLIAVKFININHETEKYE